MQDKLNKIIQMDCLEYLKSLPDNCTECVLIDEPYMLLIGNKIAENIKQKISKTLTGIKRTEESKRKMSLAKKIKLQCPFCNKIGGSSQMKRWHFNNCKIANDRIANWQENLLRQGKWLNDRGVMDFESDIKEQVKQEQTQETLI